MRKVLADGRNQIRHHPGGGAQKSGKRGRLLPEGGQGQGTVGFQRIQTGV